MTWFGCGDKAVYMVLDKPWDSNGSFFLTSSLESSNLVEY